MMLKFRIRPPKVSDAEDFHRIRISEGVKRFAVKRDGKYTDEIIMARINKKLLPENQR